MAHIDEYGVVGDNVDGVAWMQVKGTSEPGTDVDASGGVKGDVVSTSRIKYGAHGCKDRGKCWKSGFICCLLSHV
jgi:hypothetical protein